MNTFSGWGTKVGKSPRFRLDNKIVHLRVQPTDGTGRKPRPLLGVTAGETFI
jgi:hypothetical protein